jgi:hypothetical protein
MAVTMDTRVHGVLRKWVIGFLYAKKKHYGRRPSRPGAAV